MLRTRVIPALLVRDESLVKTVRFGEFTYVGDPCNTVRIFNELEVDELAVLDITATVRGRRPNLSLLRDIADECFMPVAYGGGIRNVEDAEAILRLGIEKVILNSAAVEDPALVSRLAERFGNQAVVVSIDVRHDLLGRPRVRTHSGRRDAGRDPVAWAVEAEKLGAGEILLTSMEREGTWRGFDLDLVRQVAQSVHVPVIAHGGAGGVQDIARVVHDAHASAVALGSMVVFQKKDMGVLVNFPSEETLQNALGKAPQA